MMYLYSEGNMFCKILTPSVSAQDPALEPAWITEGIIPLRMNRGDFFISGASWVKFRAHRPWASFEQFLALRESICDQRNANAIRFLKSSKAIQRGMCRFSLIALFVARLILFSTIMFPITLLKGFASRNTNP